MQAYIQQKSNDPKASLVGEIVRHALGEAATKVSLHADQGNVNRTYDVATRSGSFVLRARFDRDEMRQFLCEKQCAEIIRKTHDWTPSVVATGRFENHSYSIQEKVNGVNASQYTGDLVKVWEQVGQHAKQFHGIPTSGFLYDLFREGTGGGGVWCQRYFDDLGQAQNAKLVSKGLVTGAEFDSAIEALQPLKYLKFTPTLAHGNLTLKNIVVEPNGKAHIIDWGTCQGHLATALDLSELLAFKTPAKHVDAYLSGHALPSDYLNQNAELLSRLQLVRFSTPHIGYVKLAAHEKAIC